MNRTLKLALGVVMTSALVLPALAQENFPDVPDNHWAYEALKNMKNDGLLVGYPDGLFRGQRPASRYELAVAIHATYQKLKGMYDGLDSQIKALSASLDGKADKADLQNLRDALTALQNDVAGMKAWGDDIANLKKLADKFDKEIASLGVDVEAMKKDIGDIKDRLNNMPKPAVDIHGTVDLLALAGYSSSDRFGITVDGRPTGVGRGSYDGETVGANRDLSIMHEAALSLSGTNTEGPKWNATLVVGNMLGYDPMSAIATGAGLGVQSETSSTAFEEANESIYFQNLTVSFDTSVLGQNFTAEVGRTGYKVSPYIFQRPDTTPYFANERWDNGKYMLDGAILGFNLGQAKLTAVGGRMSTATASNSSNSLVQPLSVGRAGSPWDGANRPIGLNDENQLGMQVDQFLGLQLVAPITEKAQLNLAYLWLDSNEVGTLTTGVTYNRLAVYGGDLKVNLDPITIDGGYSASILQYNEHNVLDEENAAWNVNAAYKADKFGISAGYKNIETNFAAPGDWGRIGMWWNPVDIKGFNAAANLTINDKATLKATGEWYTGINDDYSDWGDDQKVDRYTAELGYKLNTAWDLNLGWEYVQYNVASSAPKPEEIWYNIGLNYGFNDKAKLSVLWQISDYNSKDVEPFVLGSSTKYTGGLITTQLSIKF
jgi:hypothetical protein